MSVITTGRHILSGVCEITVQCGYDGEETADGLLLTIDGENYVAYTDPEDGYRSYGSFHKDSKKYVQRNSFPGQEVIVSNEDWDEVDEYGQSCRGHKIVIYNPETHEEIFCCGTDHEDDYYPVGFWRYHPEHLPVNVKRAENSKKFDDALNTLRECLNISDEHEESCRIPVEKDACPEEKPVKSGSDYDADYDIIRNDPDGCFKISVRNINSTDWEIMEHIVRTAVKMNFQMFLDTKFDTFETSQLLQMWEEFSEKW